MTNGCKNHRTLSLVRIAVGYTSPLIDWASASLTQTKAEKELRHAEERKEFERQARAGQMGDPMKNLVGRLNDLVVTWRVWIRGPRGRRRTIGSTQRETCPRSRTNFVARA